MSVVGLNPYDLSNLLKGPCRVLRADSTQAIPTKLIDIIEVEGEYKPQRGWTDFGATTAGTAYSRQFNTASQTIEQTTGAVDEEVTDAVRAVQATFAEIDENLIQLMEQAAAIDTLAAKASREATPGYSEEKQVKFGNVESLDAHRIAFIGRRAKGLGADVTQKDRVVRGALVAGVLYRAKMTGDQAAIQLARGQLAAAPLTFQAYPEDGQLLGKEHGIWLVEQAGTIA